MLSDLTSEEFKKIYLTGYKPRKTKESAVKVKASYP
jgi:hypothetical protein